ncbi:hypothetical protein [Streptomyces sp. NPDC058665]|uniref:hypothetical protein n=1 Tax=Streptomyces sp. NPDC058665 TaxID=3346586 RepID=UPI003663F298
MEEDEIDRIQGLIDNALERREANQWNALAYADALDYNRDSELMEWNQAESQAANDYSQSLDGYQNGYLDPDVRAAAEAETGMSFETPFQLVQDRGAAYASAINGHESVREARVLSEQARQSDLAQRQQQLESNAQRAQLVNQLQPPGGNDRRRERPREEQGARGRRHHNHGSKSGRKGHK